MNERHELHNQIAKNLYESKAPDIHQIAANVPRDPEDFVDTNPDEDPQYSPDAPGLEADYEPPPSEDPKETLKVNGEEIEVPQSKVLEEGKKALQIGLATTQALEEAKQLKRQYEELLKGKTQESKPDDLTEAIQNAAFDPEAAKRVAQALQERPQQDVHKVIREEIAAQAMLDRFKNEFKDIVEDDKALRLAATMEAEKRAAGDTRPLYDIWAEVGNDIRGWKQSLSGQSKQEAKEKLRDINVAGSRLETKDAPRPKSISEQIDALAKMRGQLPPNRSM